MLANSGSRWCAAWKILTAFLLGYLTTVLLLLHHVEIESARSRLMYDLSKRGKNVSVFESSLHKFLLQQKDGHDILRGRRFGNKGHIFLSAAEIENMPFPLIRPLPFLEPILDGDPRGEDSGDFHGIHKDAYVYSAYLDDRNEDAAFIRLIMVMTSLAAEASIMCHFKNSGPRVATRYEMCENHRAPYGGYIFSCPVNTKSKSSISNISISFTVNGPKVDIPVTKMRPPESKLKYLNSYTSPQIPDLNSILRYHVKLMHIPQPTFSSSNTRSVPRYNLSFAICVPPLFGNIDLNTFIEFVELSRLLGADHFFFYTYQVPFSIRNALEYYKRQGIATSVPWTLPSEVNRIWYHGQLIAHNDCLYRAMSRFDLVAFNDIDEFIVPHSNATTWAEAFGSILEDGRYCGVGFQSAIYRKESSSDTTTSQTHNGLLTTGFSERTVAYNRDRGKVMVAPWRVFEVGIHHISKQNRENWIPYSVDTNHAFLHHYRPCKGLYTTDCREWKRDNIIEERYGPQLRQNFQRALREISEAQKFTHQQNRGF